MRLWVAVACVLSACGLQSKAVPDGGEGGGATGGGSSAGGATGGGSSAGGSATGGGSAAGGAGTGGGSSAAGGGGSSALTYAQMAVTNVSGTRMVAISGRAGEVYAVSDIGDGLYRSTGAGFTRISISRLNGARALYVASDGSVFIAVPISILTCRTNCQLGTSYTEFQLADSTDDFHGMCGDSPTNVYAVVADVQNQGSLWRYDGTSWAEAAPNLGIDAPAGCAVMSDGTVVVAGLKSVAFFKGGGTTVEQAALSPPLTTTEADFTRFYSVAAIGTKVFAGGMSRRISIRSGPNQWSMSGSPSASDSVLAMAGASESEVFAGHSADVTTQLHVWNGASWQAAPELPALTVVYSIYVAGPNEIYFAGQASGAAPTIVKAYR